jgi:hypothetical protein
VLVVSSNVLFKKWDGIVLCAKRLAKRSGSKLVRKYRNRNKKRRNAWISTITFTLTIIRRFALLAMELCGLRMDMVGNPVSYVLPAIPNLVL